MAAAPETIRLNPSGLEARGPFTLRRYSPVPDPKRTILVLDDNLVGDSAIAALRARTVSGLLDDVELLLVGFDAENFGALHAMRGEYLTFGEYDLGFAGLPATGSAAQLTEFLGGLLREESTLVGVLGYSLSASFAMRFAGQLEGLEFVGLLSAPLWLDAGLEDELAATLQAHPKARLYLAVGSLENDPAPFRPGSMVSLAEALAARLAPAMEERLDFLILPESDHTAVIVTGMDRAIRNL
ncbi:hypothetical protein [Erythrobacter sp. SD-21]|uniref:hypothetical protein n=1 Tax=Erythrobacter sp. SD-21 TaxID=161528 RepID=UPI000153F2C0|nr:hypothetical protein [Erythrobacter sp. SD-21]EDL48339.1 hypothetical protein ED21_22523 [Erythrobacter sp. SD-21]